MASNNYMSAKDLEVKTLLKYMTFAPTSKAESAAEQQAIGRFRYFQYIFKKNGSYLLTANLLFMLFALPIMAILLYLLTAVGMERFSYFIQGSENIPYFLSGAGVGISATNSLTEGQVNLLFGYRIMFLAIAACIPITFAGFAGVFHLAGKMVWEEKLLSKKDSYGNDIPLIAKEFFAGVKKYGKYTLIITAAIAAMVAGFSQLIINFIEHIMLDSATFWDYAGFILSILISGLALMSIVQLLPMLTMYRELNFLQNLKNAFLLGISVPLPTFFMVAILLLPLFLLFSGGLLVTLVLLALIMFGPGFYSLAWSVYADYNSEKIVQPIYQALTKKSKKKAKEKKKK
jgi:hypothetical protein